MSSLRRMSIIAAYEWRRALAKKKVFAFIILALAFESLVFIFLQQTSSFPGSSYENVKSYLWILGTLVGQSLFIQLVAIVIAAGSMSEEYEHGTADVLLSKPIKRTEYLFGKFLGGFSLLALIEALTVVAGVILSVWFFGLQDGLQYAPVMFLAIGYSSLIFFGLSFMLSEVFRRTTLAMLLSLAILIVCYILSPILDILYSFTGSMAYLYAIRAIPIWAATNVPSLLMGEILPISSLPTATNDLMQGVVIIAIYVVVFVLLAFYRLQMSDVAKKVD